MPYFTPPFDQSVAPVRVPEPHGTRWAARRRSSSAFQVPVPVVSFSVLSLPSLVGWYDASDTASITSSSGSVSQWNDKSGNGNHLTQATGVKQPITGSDTVNSLNAIKFNTASQFMSCAISAQPSARTVLSVVKLSALTNDRELWIPLAGAANGMQIQQRGASAGSGKWAINKSGVAVLVTSSTGDSTSATQRTFFSKGDGTSFAHNIRLNQAADGTSTSSNTYSAATTWSLGTDTGGGPIQGDVCEQIICDTILGGSDLSGAEGYLKSKWGTP